MLNKVFQSKITLILILLLAIVVRLYRFSGPVADWHSWRQADTSAVSRNFIKFGFDILHPRFDDISNVPSGIDNPNGYRFVEFPIYNIFQAGLYKVFGLLTIEEWGRIVTIFASLGSIVFLYLLVKKYAGAKAGVLSGLFFAIIPFSIYYGRTILPDPSMVATLLGGIYFFDRWISLDSKIKVFNKNFLLSILFTICSLLLKPYAAFFMLPMGYLVWEKYKFRLFTIWQLYIYAAIVFIPLIFWRVWMQQYPEGIPASLWLLNGGNIRFTGAYFYWIFADRIGRLILGYWGLPLFSLGILVASKLPVKKGSGIFYSFLFSSLIYIVVIARGNVQHDYYQILLLPSLSIFLGLGAAFLLDVPKEYFSKVTSIILLTFCFLFMIGFGWYYVRDYFNINNPSIVIAGHAIDKLIPQNAKIIAPYDGDTSFLYQTNRQGWASFEKPLPEMVRMGATYLVFINPKGNDFKLPGYKTVVASSDFVLYDLTQK